MPEAIEEVTAFITRETKVSPELLLFKHPYAANQLPAGTVEAGEAPEAAVLREAFEETGLEPLSIREYLGSKEDHLTGRNRVILTTTKVFARPDVTSFDWAYLRRGVQVNLLRRMGGFSPGYIRRIRSPSRPPICQHVDHRLGAGSHADQYKQTALLPLRFPRMHRR